MGQARLDLTVRFERRGPQGDAERTRRFAARDDQRSGRRELLRQETEFAADAVGRLVPGQAGRQVKARQSDTCLIQALAENGRAARSPIRQLDVMRAAGCELSGGDGLIGAEEAEHRPLQGGRRGRRALGGQRLRQPSAAAP